MKKSFILYSDYGDFFRRLSAEECGNLMFALFARYGNGERPRLTEAAEMLLAVITAQIDRDDARYDTACSKRAEAGRLGGIASGKARRAAMGEANEAIEAFEANEADNDNENENETEKPKERKNLKERSAHGAWDGSARVRQDPTEARAARERFYCIRRQRAEDAAEKVCGAARKDEEFREAERELRSAGSAIGRAEAKGEDTAALRERLHAAETRRARAMLRLHLTEEDLLPRYACKKCSDTGFLPDGRACDCYRPDG